MHRGDGINVQLKTFSLGFYPLDVEREIFWSRIPKKKRISFHYREEDDDMILQLYLSLLKIWFKFLQFIIKKYHLLYPYLAKLAHKVTIFFLNRLKLLLGLDGARIDFELNMYPTSSKCAVPARQLFHLKLQTIKKREEKNREIEKYRSMDCPWICA